MNTYEVEINRDLTYTYLIKAKDEEEAIEKGFNDWDGETDDVELEDVKCYSADFLECNLFEENVS